MRNRLVLAVVFLTVIFAIVHNVFEARQVRTQEACERLLMVASDSEKVAYMRTWIESDLRRKEVLGALGWIGVVRLIDKPRLKELLEIDWDYLMINSNYASVRVNRVMKDRDDFEDWRNIKSVEFGENRNSIAVLVNSSSDYFLRGLEELPEKLIEVSDGIAVFCPS